MWYSVRPELKLGLAYLAKQRALRYLASVRVLPEHGPWPSLSASAGVQGIGTGNPGYSVTLEKNVRTPHGTWNVYAGAGWRSNENVVREVAGLKYSFANGVTLGLQDDGKVRNPFVTYSLRGTTFGVYLVGGKEAAFLVGHRF